MDSSSYSNSLKSRRTFHVASEVGGAKSSILLFPPEVLSEIFLHCLPKGRPPVVHASEAPLLLGSICSLWRAVALATPGLWATIHIASPLRKHETPTLLAFQALCIMVKTWLGRSAALPITLSCCIPHWGPDPYDASPLVDALTLFSRRWKHVKLSMGRSVVPPITFACISTPILESFTLLPKKLGFRLRVLFSQYAVPSYAADRYPHCTILIFQVASRPTSRTSPFCQFRPYLHLSRPST
ncbi:hypothetical protein HGRIS_014978 [Hohenbuehelia grisea]|uniref:F-box domain-containing protein n=1 Tax=Hohenbuehelia grisea TaxID=104357 RepID=A0ABR3IW00_9AGAR